MPSKRKKPTDEGHGATVDFVEQKTQIDESPSAKSSGLKTSLHGNIFQLKLLVLFLIRGIRAKYQFKLGSEIPGTGGKFDDLIFKYKVPGDDESRTQEVQAERYRYLQAKHKQNEKSKKIKAFDLLNDSDKVFSLPKYFRSYCYDLINRTKGLLPESVQDCIICTNIGFEDEENLRERGIELLPQKEKDDILTFEVSETKSPARYKLKETEALCQEMTKWSEIHLLAKMLLKYVINNKTLTLIPAIFKSYHVALIAEVIDKEEKKLCTTFLERDSHFREILSEITFVHYWEKLKFKCDNKKKIRHEDSVDSRKKLSDFDETLLTKWLPKYSEATGLDFCIFEDFRDDLIEEQIIDAVGKKLKAKPFTKNFIQGKGLKEKGSEFRKKLRKIVFIHFWKDLTIQLSEEFGIIRSSPDENKSLNELVNDQKIRNFLDKLVFAVHTPNEVELDNILKMEVDDRYSLHESDFQSDFLLRNMLDWFKKKESDFMTTEEGVEILQNGKKKMKSLRLTAVSIDYQRQLMEVCEFNEESIREMAKKLTQILTSVNEIECIVTQLPKLTAAKVIAALKESKRYFNENCKTAKVNETSAAPYFQRKDSYLITSFKRLQRDCSILEKTRKDKISHRLLIIVCDGETLDDNDQFPLSLTQEEKDLKIKKKIIIISEGGSGMIDDLKFTNLSDKSQTILLSKEIMFQGALQTVRALLVQESDGTILNAQIQNGKVTDDVIDFSSMKELMKKEKIVIPSYSSTRFEKSLYIKRRLISLFPLDEDFWREVVEELKNKYSLQKIKNDCRISSQGEIQWFVKDDKEKSKIWEKITNVFEKRNLFAKSQNCPIPEDNLLNHEQNTLPRVMIVSGVAGTGKSSILSHHYEKIKDNKLDHWVIIINLTDHSEAFFKLKSEPLHEFSAVDFLIHLSVVDSSAFARSLLKHRLETGDRIEIMLDGFDESHYQEIVVKMIEAIKQTNLRRLFVTTRSHMASQLQFNLSQLTYSLENFSQQDQINYLTSLWKRDLEPVVENRLRQFAESVVERVSITLKDQDRDFIGIPLQCRILADCFQSEVQEAARHGSTINSLFKMITELKFNLASLYRLLMDKKREIYRQEKIKAEAHNLLVKSHIDEDMKYLNVYLRTLAIETIVSTKEHVDALLGRQKQLIQSENDQNEEKEKRTDHSVRFGLLDTNAKGQVQFLHRTYPEFLMAEYLYNGFLIDETCRNKLLEYESIRKLIIDQIFAKVQFDGVQVFINSMLKEIVDGNEKWRANVAKGDLPERFFKLSEVLFGQFLRQIRKPYSRKHPNALRFSAKNRKEKIFKFLCDCLDATFDKSDVLRGMTISFLLESCTEDFVFSLKVFCHQSSEVFQRFVGYYATANTNTVLHDSDCKDVRYDVKMFIEKVFHGMPISDLENSFWNEKEQQNLIEYLLDAMKNQKEAIDVFFQPYTECYIEPLFTLLILNENYENHLEKFLQILSQMTSAYSDDSKLANFIKNVFLSVKKKNRKGGQIMKDSLFNKERKNLAVKIFVLVFSIESDSFEGHFRLYTREEVNEILSKETVNILNFLLERDFFHITPLHRLAFNDERDAIENILRKVEKSFHNETDLELKDKAEKVVNVISHDENGFTPFYVAAARGHEIIYTKLLVFLKDVNKKRKTFDTFESNLMATNGFLYHALSDAMQSENLKMFQIILCAVKNILGQKCLLNLLKSKSRENKTKLKFYDLDSGSDTIFGVACRSKELFLTLANIVVQNYANEDYQDWNDLVFHLIENEGFDSFTLKYVNNEILQGMLSQDSSYNWTKRLLGRSLNRGFEVLSNHLITNFHEDQLREFITMLTTKYHPDKCSYWYELTTSSCFEDLNEDGIISKFMKCVSEKIGESFVYELVIHDDENYRIRSKARINILLSHLSKERQHEAKQHWKMNSTKKINDTFSTPTSKIFWRTGGTEINYLENIIWFYLDHGSDAQLKDFIETITFLHGNCKRSMWSYVFEKDRAANQIIKHVSEKEGIFGGGATKKLFFHVVDEDPRYLNAIWWKKDIDELLVRLPRNVQEGIQQYIKEHAFIGLVEKIFENPDWLISYDTESYTILNTLTLIVNYSNENQLQQFIQYIKVKRKDMVKDRSIWCELFRPEHKDDYIKMMGKFLKSVLDKLGSSEVKGLLLHADDGGEDSDTLIYAFALSGDEKVIESMLSYLDDNDREKVQRKVNKYLDKTFTVPPKRKTKEASN